MFRGDEQNVISYKIKIVWPILRQCREKLWSKKITSVVSDNNNFFIVRFPLLCSWLLSPILQQAHADLVRVKCMSKQKVYTRSTTYGHIIVRGEKVLTYCYYDNSSTVNINIHIIVFHIVIQIIHLQRNIYVVESTLVITHVLKKILTLYKRSRLPTGKVILIQPLKTT